MMLRTLAFLAAILMVAVAGPVLAQEPVLTVGEDGAEVRTYPPAYFDRFNPQTAADMVRRIPGFSIRNNGSGRGLGQGGTNVLINGERVTSKDTGAIAILERTPVQNVVRIDVADAAALGVTGLTGQVANVILERSSLSGSFEYRPEFRQGVKPRLTNGLVSISGKRGGVDYTVGFENESRRGFEEGPEAVLDGQLIVVETRDEHLQVKAENPTITYDFGFDVGPKTSVSLTGSAALFTFDELERSDSSDGSFRTASNAEDEWNADLTMEVARQAGPGTARFIGYGRFENSPTRARTRTRTPGEHDLIQTFEQVVDEGEMIGRIEYVWSRPSGVSWEVASEAVYNFIDVEADFTIQDGFDVDTIPVPATRVEEARTVSSLTRSFRIGERLDVQASGGFEWSRISVTGDAPEREESFLRPRGFVSMAYPVTENFDIRARIDRSVGQLRFFDFVNSVNLTEERQQAGNTSLVPQQAWDGEIEFQKNFGGGEEQVVLRLFGSLIEDRVDRVLLDVPQEDGSIVRRDAVGNIDEARFAGAEITGTVLTDRWKFPGGRFDFSGARRTSQIEDQLTGEDRNFSGIEEWRYNIDFRQDVPQTEWAWGAGLQRGGPQTLIRFDEIARNSITMPFYGAFIEHKDFFGMNLNVSVRNIANTEFKIDRVRYAEFRDSPDIDSIERRVRTDNQRYTIQLSGTF